MYKVFKGSCVFEDSYFANDMSLVARARPIIEAFSWHARQAGVEVHMNKAEIWFNPAPDLPSPFPDGRRERLLVEPMIEGDYLKFNSNSGHSNGDKLMGALSHFSYHHSQGQELLCDLQGGKYSKCYVLTDPVIMSLDRKYGPTDLGERGISNFFAHHRCSELCNRNWRKFLLPEATIPVREGSSMALAPPEVRPTQQQRLDDLQRKLRLAAEEDVSRGQLSQQQAEANHSVQRAFLGALGET